MQDGQLGVNDLVFPEKQNARVTRLPQFRDDKELLLRHQERVKAPGSDE
jgi:hypothetical protein